jgi:5,10-methylenetetrahydrofolate reductase
MQNQWAEALAAGRFVVTTEEAPPTGADLADFFRRSAHLRGLVDAVNVTESSSAIMTMSPLGVVPGLLAQGHHPVLQITCRDRNRVALQSELLAAAALGAGSVLAMAGDPVEAGDQPETVPVFDLDTPGLLRAIATLNGGHDLAGKRLSGTPEFFPGAVVNPGALDPDIELRRMEQKVEAGARFFQTQAVYDPTSFERFMRRAGKLGVPVIAGFIVPKSAAMARRLNLTLPGVNIPESLISQLARAGDRRRRSVELSGHLLSHLAACCQGVHVIAVGWEDSMGDILEVAGLTAAAGS